MITTYSYFNLYSPKRVKHLVLPVFLILLFFSSIVTAQTTQTFNTSGNFTVPAGVTSITVQAWGGGGGGGSSYYNKWSAGGGGGGAYTYNIISVTPGQSYPVIIGNGGSRGGYDGMNGGDGGNSSFSTVIANGGKGGGGVPQYGNINGSGGSGGLGGLGGTRSGGSGANGANVNNATGGGGGSSAGTGANGNNATGQNGASAPTGGGAGGAGGNNDNSGNPGFIPGGGGGGGGDAGGSENSGGWYYAGGLGANGQILLTWTCPTYSINSTSATSPICKGSSTTVTLTSSTGGLPIGTYTVTYDLSGANVATGITKTMIVTTAGTGSFLTGNLANSGNTTITIKNLSSGSGTPSCGSVIIANNTFIINVTLTDAADAGNVTAGSTPQCIGQTTTYTVSGQVLGGGVTGSWSSSNVAVATVNPSTGVVTAIGAGTCNIIYTVSGGSCYGDPSSSQPYTVTTIPVTPGTITVTAAECPSLTSKVYSIEAVTGATTYNWSVPTGWSIIAGSGTTSITVGIGPASQNGNISVSAQNICGASSATTLAVTLNPINYWTGSVSTDWNNTANWISGVPNIENILDIVIPNGCPNYPLLRNDLSRINIEIQSGALLNVENYGLTITGALTLKGKIDLQNKSQLIQTQGSILDSDCTTGVIEIDQQGTSDNFKYNYWGSPVNTTGTTYTIAGVLRDGSFPSSIKTINFGTAYTHADTKVIPTADPLPLIKLSTYWMYKYTNKAAGDYNAWTPVGKDGVLKAGEGFTMKGSNSTFAEQNYTFVGKPNNGNYYLNIDIGNQYLIGNPYPSALDANQFIRDNIEDIALGRDNIIDGNLYFWDHFGGGTHFLKSYEGGYSIYNLSGGVAAIANDTRINATLEVSCDKALPYIPVAQGFFVMAMDGGEIQFKNSQRVFQQENGTASQFLRNTATTKATKTEGTVKDTSPRIYLKYSSPTGLHRQLLVAFIPTTTDSIDIGYEAINGEKFSEDMSWKMGNTKLVIQAVPTLDNERILPLEVKVAKTGVAKISIDLLENISEDTEIFLKDNLSGIEYDIKTAPFEVNLEPGIYTNRFELTFKTPKLIISEEEDFIEDSVSIYLNNPENTIFINYNESADIKEISIYNMLGQQIQSIKKEFNSNTIKIPFGAQSGVYIVNVTTGKETISKKIIKL